MAFDRSRSSRISAAAPTPRGAWTLTPCMRALILAGLAWAPAPFAIAGGAPVPKVNLPVPCTVTASCGPSAGANLPFVTNGAATYTVNGSVGTINQSTAKAILNWQVFDIANGNTVRFVQPNSDAATLNRVFDATPSVINGALQANGQIYLINRNGILFGPGARVDTSGLVASSLNVNDSSFINGVLSSGKANVPVFDGSDRSFTTDPLAMVAVLDGAAINIANAGRVMLLAPRVQNAGVIAAPDGQIVLAAGSRVFVQASTDSNLRGLLVEVANPGVDASGRLIAGSPQAAQVQANTPGVDPTTVASDLGTARNLGALISNRGNTTLVGLAVNQSGLISASTSVQENGSIRLVARDRATGDAPTDPNIARFGTRTGTVTIGAGSTMQALPDTTSAATLQDSQTFVPGSIDVTGHRIDVEPNATLIAPSGTIALRAVADPQSSATTPNDTRVLIGAGATISVAGLRDVQAPVSRNVITVELRGDELKDAPLQRDSVLRGKKIQVDVRKGTPLVADLSGYTGQIARTAAERSTLGGSIALGAEGDVVVAPGARLDVSGGSIQYQPGYLQTTRLYDALGRIVDISKATPDRVYAGVADTYTATYAKWGVQETFRARTAGVFDPGYTEGRAAGRIDVSAPALYLGGTMTGTTVRSPDQRADATLSGGTLVVGTVPSVGVADAVLGADVRFAATVPSLPSGFDLGTPLVAALRGETVLSTDWTASGGIANLAVYTNGTARVADGTPLTLPTGGSLSVSAQQIVVDGAITARAGAVSLNARGVGSTAYVANATGPTRPGSASVSGRSSIDVRGVWSNDARLPVAGGAVGPDPRDTRPIAPNGGTIAVTGLNDVTLAAGARLDASAAGSVASSGKLSAGTPGAITLASNVGCPEGNACAAPLTVNAALRADGLTGGGSLTLTAPTVVIDGSGPASASGLTTLADGTFKVDPSVFTRGGFANFTITGVNALQVLPGVQVQARVDNRLLTADPRQFATGSDLATFTTLGALTPDQRPGVNITLAAASASNGRLTVANGASIATPTGGSVTLKAGRALSVDGTIDAPAGAITLALNGDPSTPDLFPDQALLLGDHARLTARGAARTTTDALGNVIGTVASGGRITLRTDLGTVVAQSGATLDVSGTRAHLDIPNADGTIGRTVASDAGAITISARDGAVVDAAMTARGGGEHAAGGRFSMTVESKVPSLDGSPANRRLIVTDGRSSAPAGLQPGDAIPSALNGIGAIDARGLARAGFDDIALRTDGRIVLSDQTSLVARHSVQLDAPTIDASSANARVAASYVVLGNTGALTQTPTTPTAGTGTLRVDADLIDLAGRTALSGIASTVLTSRGDLRARGVLPNDTSIAQATGGLSTTGDLTLAAAQVYPVTLANFDITAGGKVTITSTAAPPDVPMSVGGRLGIAAQSIEQDGVVRAPFGRIALNATGALVLAPTSITSTSAQGKTLPFGQTANGRDWQYNYGDRQASITTPPQGRIELQGHDVDVRAGARVDLSGGGDLYGYEFTPGPGGSKDVLDNPNVYAIVPSVTSTFAPWDAQYLRSSAPLPGQQVYLAGGAGIAAGTYTLLPARYALLPGAYAVTVASANSDARPGQSTVRLDGASTVPGYLTRLDGAVSDARWSTFLVTPGTVVRKQSQYTDSVATTFFGTLAQSKQTDAPPLPTDSGNLSIAASASLALNGTIDLTAGRGGKGGNVDIAAAKVAIVDGSTPAPDGALVLDASQLQRLGAQSVLIGGRRTTSTDTHTTSIDVAATNVDVLNSANTSLVGNEWLFAARDTVRFGAGSSVRANGSAPSSASSGSSASNTPDTTTIAGDGAFVRVSSGPASTLQRTGTLMQSQGTVTVGAGASLTTPGSLLIDGSQTTRLASDATLAGSSIAISSSRITVTSTPDASLTGLVLTPTLSAQVQRAADLTLHSYSSIDLVGAATLGTLNADGTPALGHLTLDAQALRGLANAGATARITAASITLANSQGAGAASLPPAADGTLVLTAAGGPGDLAGRSGRIVLAAGDKRVDGYANVTFAATDRIATLGNGSTTIAQAIGGRTQWQTPLVTGASGSTQAVTVGGALEITLPTGATAGASRSSDDSAGAALSFDAQTVRIAGTVEAPAGRIEIVAHASGANALRIDDGAVVRASGVDRRIVDATVRSPAGRIGLTATDGDVSIAPTATIDVGAPGDGSAGGTLAIVAAHGNALLGGTLLGRGANGENDASVSIDAQRIATTASPSGNDIDGVDRLLDAGGFTASRELRVRAGDVAIAGSGDNGLQASRIALTVDGGKLDVTGSIATLGAKDGRITLAARDNLTLGAAARIDAHTDATSDSAPQVQLSTVSGSIDARSGATIDVGAPGTGGLVRMRAPRVQSNGVDTDVAIASGAPAAIRGASRVELEGVGVVQASVITAQTINALRTTTQAFMTNAALTSGRFSSTRDGLAPLVVPGVEVQSVGDLTLATTLDFRKTSFGAPDANGNARYFDWRYGAGAQPSFGPSDPSTLGTAGVLTLRAGGNLNLAATINDGYAAAPTAPTTVTALQAGDSWSYRLVGGADLASANPLATQRGATLNGDVSIAQNKLVRTGSGSIDIAAARDFVLNGGPGSGYAAVYTAGTLLPALDGFNPSASAAFGDHGGDIRIRAGRDAVGFSTGQLVANWLFRQGLAQADGSFRPGTFNASWWVRADQFQQNVATFAGGNVEIDAGRDVNQLSASAATNARLPGTRPDASRLQVTGGGDVRVRAGANIDGGVYYVGRGNGSLTAGDAVQVESASFAGQPLGVRLGLGDAQWRVTARGNVEVEGIFDAMALPQSPRNAPGTLTTAYYLYTDASAARVQSVSGNVDLFNRAELFASAAVDGLLPAANAGPSVYPSSLVVEAPRGDITHGQATSGSDILLFPSARGQLALVAGGTVDLYKSLQMSDADPALTYRPWNPPQRGGFRVTTGVLEGVNPAAIGTAHANTPLHAGDAQPVEVYALTGDIVGTQGATALKLAKAARIVAGRDIVNLGLNGENIGAADTTSIAAGRDVRFDTARNSSNGFTANLSTIKLGGPGTLDVQAGRDIDLGNAVGIVTNGNLDNLALPAQGATIALMAGTPQGAAWSAFATKYLDPAHPHDRAANYSDALVTYMDRLTGASLTEAQAWAQFVALPELQQRPLIRDVFYRELRDAGRDANNVASGHYRDYGRGFDAIATLFPTAGVTPSTTAMAREGVQATVVLPKPPYRGDINVFFSQLRTERGGGIDTLTPGGRVVAGLANVPADLLANKRSPGLFKSDGQTPLDDSASKLGVVTVRGGSVHSMSDGDFLVNQSRVFTLGGGDILLWSSNGNIDAGKGAKTASSAPPPRVLIDNQGKVVTDISGVVSGSGIGVLLAQPGTVPGDVDLVAPRGEVNAGDAGIRAAGNLNIAAVRVVGADNIQVGGLSTGVPVGGLSSVGASLAGVGSVAADAAKSAEQATRSLADSSAQASQQLKENFKPAFVTVEVICLGTDCK